MTSLMIGEGSQVTLHFALRLATGELIDSNFDAAPATFRVGDGNLLPAFERALFGMSAGQQKTMTIAAEQGFGQRNPNNIQHFKRGQFASDMPLEVGLMVSFADAQNMELPGVVKSIVGDDVTIDFNHPLAGCSIEFEVHILTVIPAATH